MFFERFPRNFVVERVLNLIEYNVTFFKVQDAVAVNVGSVNEERFKEDFAMSFHDIMHVQENGVNISPFVSKMM
jgi:hypothetical protein